MSLRLRETCICIPETTSPLPLPGSISQVGLFRNLHIDRNDPDFLNTVHRLYWFVARLYSFVKGKEMEYQKDDFHPSLSPSPSDSLNKWEEVTEIYPYYFFWPLFGTYLTLDFSSIKVSPVDIHSIRNSGLSCNKSSPGKVRKWKPISYGVNNNSKAQFVWNPRNAPPNLVDQ